VAIDFKIVASNSLEKKKLAKFSLLFNDLILCDRLFRLIVLIKSHFTASHLKINIYQSLNKPLVLMINYCVAIGFKIVASNSLEV
ncbi:hypothetical protein BpHYR1_049673, partial [Brachionus plicatilis]